MEPKRHLITISIDFNLRNGLLHNFHFFENQNNHADQSNM